MTEQQIIKKLAKIERELERFRYATPLTHGAQSMRYAKASRKADELCKEKFTLRVQLSELQSITNQPNQ